MMNELSVNQTPVKRRSYSPQFKRQIVEACLAKEASVPKIALAHGLNANMVHRWIRKSQGKSPAATPGFVALPMPGHAQASSVSSAKQTVDAESIRVEIPYRQQSISISWPVSQTDRCLALLRELLQ